MLYSLLAQSPVGEPTSRGRPRQQQARQAATGVVVEAASLMAVKQLPNDTADCIATLRINFYP